MPLQPGATLENGKYHIEAAIGRGGFGYVYRAREQLTGELVAIKEMVPTLVGDEQMVQRFIQEARATLRLTHPNIARTYHIFRDGDTYYLAMEYLSGGSLSDRLRRGPIPIETVLSIVRDLCAALDYAHGLGVVHCDLKPANILFDGQGGVHLADFGVAHVSEQLMTRQFQTGTGMTMGTMRYMAPEQLEGVRDDPRIDVYALGAIVYEMLAGRPYLDFETETTPAAQVRNLQRIQAQPPRPLRSVNPSVPENLAQVVDRALRKTPAERFPTAAALWEALQRSGASLREVRVAAPSLSVEPPPTQIARPPKPRPKQGLAGWQWLLLALLAILLLGACGLVAFLLLGDGLGRPTPTPQQVLRPTERPLPAFTTGPTATLMPTRLPSTPTPSRIEREQALLDRVQWRTANGKPVFVYRVGQPPTLDGFLDTAVEWTGQEFPITYIVDQPENWQGLADLSGGFYVSWDDGNLYLGLNIRDDAHVQASGGQALYNGDDVEIQLDTNLLGDFAVRQLNNDDVQLGMAVYDLVTGSHGAYRWLPSALESPLDLAVGVAPTAEGYTLEVAVPWAALSLSPRAEMPYGFCLSLSDTDTPGLRDQESMVSSCPNRKWGDPTAWGTLILTNW